jgi:hypothetical protein
VWLARVRAPAATSAPGLARGVARACGHLNDSRGTLTIIGGTALLARQARAAPPRADAGRPTPRPEVLDLEFSDLDPVTGSPPIVRPGRGCARQRRCVLKNQAASADNCCYRPGLRQAAAGVDN